MQFHEKFLPVQPPLSKYFQGTEEDLLRAIYETSVRFSQGSDPQEDFTLEESERFSVAEMGSNPIQRCFLETLVMLKQPKSILEVGTFIGVSAMSMARALCADGKLVTIERYDHFADIARRNIEKNGFADKISLIEGDAFEELQKMGKDPLFDMVFLDGNKERYKDYFDIVDPLINPGGLLLVDDVFFHGDALNDEPQTEKGRGVRRFLEGIKDLAGYHRAIFPVSNGLLLMVKQGP